MLEPGAGKPARRLTYFSLSRERDLQQAGERNATPGAWKLSSTSGHHARERSSRMNRRYDGGFAASSRRRSSEESSLAVSYYGRSISQREKEREREREKIGPSFRHGSSVIARPREDHNFEKRVNMEGFQDALEDRAKVPARAANRKDVH